MLISWEKRVGLQREGEASDSKDVFQRLLTDFWEELGLLCVSYVDNEEADPQALEGIATLLHVSLLLKSLCSNVFSTEMAILALRMQEINMTVRAIYVKKRKGKKGH